MPRPATVLRTVLGIALLWGFALLGERLTDALQLTVPGSVLGMVGLWIALETGLIRLAWVDAGASLLLRWLGLLFVPAAVGFVQFAGDGTLWLQAGAVILVGVLVSLAVTATAVQRGIDAE